jgi:hypothetical protein
MERVAAAIVGGPCQLRLGREELGHRVGIERLDRAE